MERKKLLGEAKGEESAKEALSTEKPKEENSKMGKRGMRGRGKKGKGKGKSAKKIGRRRRKGSKKAKEGEKP